MLSDVMLDAMFQGAMDAKYRAAWRAAYTPQSLQAKLADVDTAIPCRPSDIATLPMDYAHVLAKKSRHT